MTARHWKDMPFIEHWGRFRAKRDTSQMPALWDSDWEDKPKMTPPDSFSPDWRLMAPFITPGARVIEVGCGLGQWVRFLVQLISGRDPSSWRFRLSKRLAERYPRCIPHMMAGMCRKPTADRRHEKCGALSELPTLAKAHAGAR